VTLEDVLMPLTTTEFVEKYLGQRHLLAKLRPGRFACLAHWSEINEGLRHARFSGDRLRIVQSGKDISRSAYLAPGCSGHGLYVNARRLEALLAGGATLILNCADELFSGVQTLAESCEEFFRIPVSANLYAGWRKDQAFELHWDDHDTLVLQLAGRKRWLVFEPTEPHPLPGASVAAPPTPRDLPVWQGVLEDGDLLYMPRGWWHVAFPMDEPTLHLTVAWPHRTGADLLRWVFTELKRYVDVRTDLPHLRDVESQAAYVSQLRSHVVTALTDDVVERFMRMADASIPVRPLLFLPELGPQRPTAIDGNSRLRLTNASRLRFELAKDHTVTFQVNDCDWSCDAALTPALRILRRTRPTTLGELMAAVEPAWRIPVKTFVLMMAVRNVVWAEPAIQ
jgi:hypothetical protein